MRTHTNGTWYVSSTLGDQGLIVCEETGASIAVAYDPDNANLIAASPKLFDALEWALQQIDDDLDPDHQAALKAAHQALNEAKGE